MYARSLASVVSTCPRVPAPSPCAFRWARRRYADSAPAAGTESSFRAAPLPPPKNPIGAVRGGIIGLLFGVVLAGTVGYKLLLDDYAVYSNALLTNVQDLTSAVDSIRSRLGKADALETDVKSLKSTSIHHDDLDKAKRDLYKALDNISVEHLELKTRVWALEQQLKATPSN